MTHLDQTTRLFLLPKNHAEFKIIEFASGSRTKSLALSSNSLYEVKEVGWSSSFDSNSEPKCLSGQPVKSLIIEALDGNSGFVMSNPTMIVFNEFNLLLPLIEWICSSELYVSRFHTSEDLLDAFASRFNSSEIVTTFASELLEGLRLICDSICENGESFFRFNKEKAHGVITDKIEKMKNFILTNPQSSLYKRITSSLSASGEGASEKVVEQQTLKYSIDYIFGSYLCESMKKAYTEAVPMDFSSLLSFLKEQRALTVARAVADNNLANVSSNIDHTRGNSLKQTSKKSTNTKKQKKVAVGKGALDSFFKKG